MAITPQASLILYGIYLAEHFSAQAKKFHVCCCGPAATEANRH